MPYIIIRFGILSVGWIRQYESDISCFFQGCFEWMRDGQAVQEMINGGDVGEMDRNRFWGSGRRSRRGVTFGFGF